MATTPKDTFSPCQNSCVSCSAVSPLWIECAAASPPDSKPRPESSVLASTTRSSAGVTTLRSHAWRAATPSASRVS